MGMKVLIVDGGGRGHALAWKAAQSSHLQPGGLFVAPGNAGTAQIAKNVPIAVKDTVGLRKFAVENKIGLTFATSDDALGAGIVDEFQAFKLKILGPTQGAARLESSKSWAKNAMVDAGVPTARFAVFTDPKKSVEFVCKHGAPIVVKAFGLALGKGVRVCKTVQEAKEAIEDFMVKKIYGSAGEAVVIEDFLTGPEISIHAFCDGRHFSLWPSAQDHKPVFDGGLGPNTGGMGTIAPVPWVSRNTMDEVARMVVGPIMKEVDRRNSPFEGVMYPGLMMTPEGMRVLEFNARPGDPETQSYMRLLKTDIVDIAMACVDGRLNKCKIEWDPGYAACIVAASGGYPGDYQKGLPITGIADAEKISGVVVFHAGTIMDRGVLRTAGGRVVGVTAKKPTLEEALKTAYAAMDCIKFEGKHFRRDIGAVSLAMAKARVPKFG